MRKLLYAAIGLTAALASASPAFAQDVQSDLRTAIQNRAAIEDDMADLAAQAAGATADAAGEAVLGESALPAVGVDAPFQVKLDLLAALRADAAKNRALKLVPTGLSID